MLVGPLGFCMFFCSCLFHIHIQLRDLQFMCPLYLPHIHGDNLWQCFRESVGQNLIWVGEHHMVFGQKTKKLIVDYFPCYPFLTNLIWWIEIPAMRAMSIPRVPRVPRSRRALRRAAGFLRRCCLWHHARGLHAGSWQSILCGAERGTLRCGLATNLAPGCQKQKLWFQWQKWSNIWEFQVRRPG